MNDYNLKLNVSKKFILNNNEENINLNLEKNKIYNNGSVYGTVYDGTLSNPPLAGATVKVFTSDGIPYQHTLTDSKGKYTIGNLPIGTYTIATVKDGYMLSEDIPLIITNNGAVNIDLIAKPINTNNNIVYGIITDSITNLPIDGAIVQLYKDIDGTKTLIKNCNSISDGEYIIDNIEDGNYTISYTKTGYQTIEIQVDLKNGIKLSANESMVSTIGQINNTISGIIKDNDGNIIANAHVALYKIDNDKEILIATTYTNNLGKYMFGNVIDGNYLVKSSSASYNDIKL